MTLAHHAAQSLEQATQARRAKISCDVRGFEWYQLPGSNRGPLDPQKLAQSQAHFTINNRSDGVCHGCARTPHEGAAGRARILGIGQSCAQPSQAKQRGILQLRAGNIEWADNDAPTYTAEPKGRGHSPSRISGWRCRPGIRKAPLSACWSCPAAEWAETQLATSHPVSRGG